MMRGAFRGALLYVAMLVFTLVDFAFAPAAWERANGAVFLALLALVPAYLVSGAVSGWFGRIHARLIRYPLVGAAYGGPVGAFFREALPLTATSYALESPYRLTIAESALYGTLAFFAGGLLLALAAAFREWRNRGAGV